MYVYIYMYIYHIYCNIYIYISYYIVLYYIDMQIVWRESSWGELVGKARYAVPRGRGGK